MAKKMICRRGKAVHKTRGTSARSGAYLSTGRLPEKEAIGGRFEAKPSATEKSAPKETIQTVCSYGGVIFIKQGSKQLLT